MRLCAFDVDGVLTDGRLVYGPQGEAFKTFNVRDGHGIVLLRLAGVECAVLSGRESEIVRTRMRELGVYRVYQGERDKADAFGRLCRAAAVTPSEVAYMGDDVNDVPVLERCALAACPADACAEAKERAHLVARAGGGLGAARELCDLILEARR